VSWNVTEAGPEVRFPHSIARKPPLPTTSPRTLSPNTHDNPHTVLDATAAFVQHYAYTAYGLAIGFDEAAALTTLLYSGEAFDSRVGLQYLRARWYDPNAGRFNRLDPFSGNLTDPQSLHKYLYVHGDPVNGWDPTGLRAFNVSSLLTSMAIGTLLGGSLGYVWGGWDGAAWGAGAGFLVGAGFGMALGGGAGAVNAGWGAWPVVGGFAGLLLWAASSSSRDDEWDVDKVNPAQAKKIAVVKGDLGEAWFDFWWNGMSPAGLAEALDAAGHDVSFIRIQTSNSSLHY
jgi:RHS repeat-associated protein